MGLQDGEWEVFGERSVYTSPWLSVNLVDVQPPTGNRFEHHAIRMRPVAVIGLVKDNRVLLAWRHRFIPDVWAWELPGGVVEDQETPAQAAAREVVEETGWRPGRVEHVVTIEPMAGIAATPHHAYIGYDPVQESTDRDITECVRLDWVPIDSIPNFIQKRKIVDSASVVGLQQIYIRNLTSTPANKK